ncbi:uncharacterized protein BDR25DRAFT_377389 [Lindgomyces ingoldianus]|uniref:Uncharacterized protein n=1 Tax=Lindgomyces ingoldianus TaxID=673940 RepID=A0ACB6QJI8_9PLEO|nr:uncharacterized protein BDR25DRAFT_377389 [Lindgomyces ingoldianus]KAF2466297.1 hypothetical protein BDR25DRAFT_377389 [Lindgomyces ingoldianus]
MSATTDAKLNEEKNEVVLEDDLDKSNLEQAEPVDSQDDPEHHKTERSFVRKLALTLMPMVWVLYLFNYLDRNNIAQAKLNTFEKDLGLEGSEFNTAVSILNVG